jgi:hypothetical protein
VRNVPNAEGKVIVLAVKARRDDSVVEILPVHLVQMVLLDRRGNRIGTRPTLYDLSLAPGPV